MSKAEIQKEYQKQWLGIADFERKPERMDFDDKTFFYDPDGVREWALAYYRSNYHTGHLPLPGVGMRHQHWTVRHDWYTWLNGLVWAQGEVEEGRRLKEDEIQYFKEWDN